MNILHSSIPAISSISHAYRENVNTVPSVYIRSGAMPKATAPREKVRASFLIRLAIPKSKDRKQVKKAAAAICGSSGRETSIVIVPSA